MKLTADFHTHTRYSHGKGTILDNAMAGKQLGLDTIAITDHGFSHIVMGLNSAKMPNYVKDCKNATQQTGVNVLVGIESNVLSVNGDVDLLPNRYDDFDVFLAGAHKLVWYKWGSLFTYGVPNVLKSFFKHKTASQTLIKNTTKALVETIKKNPVDIITHLSYCVYLDPVEVAKVACDYGTYIELNARKVHLTDEELYQVAKTGVRFVINSDAHDPKKIGDITLVEEILKRVDIPLDRIDNIDGRYPNFRFKAYKEKSL